MSRSKSKVLIQEQPSGQVMVTIPRALAGAMGWKKGELVEWRVGGASKLELIKPSPKE